MLGSGCKVSGVGGGTLPNQRKSADDLFHFLHP